MTNTTRYSSCSERSVKLSDIIKRPDRPSLLDSAMSSSCATPVTDEPVRPPRTLQPVNQSTEVRKRSVRTSSSGSTLRNATAASSAKTPTCSARKSPAAQADRKTLVSASGGGGTPLANRTNRLVTITSYKSRNSASVKPDDASGMFVIVKHFIVLITECLIRFLSQPSAESK